MVSFPLVSLVPLLGSNAVGYLRSRRIVEALVEGYLREMVGIQARHVSEHLQGQVTYLAAVGAGNRFLQAAAERDRPGADQTMTAVASPTAVAGYLRRQLDESGRFANMALFSPDGDLIASAYDNPRAFRRVGSATDPIEVLRGDDPGGPPTFRFTAPVTSQAGEVVAYLSGSVPTSDAQSLLEIPEHRRGSIESFIVDAANRPIFVSHAHSGFTYDRPLENPLGDLPSGSHGHYVNAEGVDVIGTGVSIPGTTWVFVAEAPAESAFSDLRALSRLSFFLGGLFSVLVVATGWLLAGGVVAPVRRLVDATTRVSSGDLGARVPEESRDEIGELSVAFNQMAAELAENADRIRELHAREIERAGQLATVGELASGMAHEIKNPLVSISNGMDLVLRRLGPDPELEPIALEMKRELGRIERVVRDLLAFARPAKPDLAPCEVNEIVRRALRLVEPAAQKSGVRVQVELEPEIPPLDLDSEQIMQALVNLAVNAVQHSVKGDAVRVTTRAVGDERVEIEVRDTGSGMDEEVLNQLFKPFFTTRHSGTGLGLSITRGIVEHHGGHLSVTSVKERGSSFTIALPVARPDAGGE